MKPRLTAFDILRICGYVIAGGALLTPDVLHALGFSSDLASTLSTMIGRVVLIATLVSNVVRNPSPPSGTVSANIPIGTTPVVAPLSDTTPGAASK